MAGGAAGVGATSSRLRRLAGTTPATVSAQLFTVGGTDLLSIAGVVPAVCIGGGACGNTNGSSNVPIVDSGVEFGFNAPENIQLDITTR
jgi:hypothetical protein